MLQVFGHIFFVSSNLQNSGLQKSSKISSSSQALTVEFTRKIKIINFIFGMSLIWRVESDNWKIRGFDFASGWNHDVIATPQITYDYPYHIHNHKQITPLSYTLRHSKSWQFWHFLRFWHKNRRFLEEFSFSREIRRNSKCIPSKLLFNGYQRILSLITIWSTLTITLVDGLCNGFWAGIPKKIRL